MKHVLRNYYDYQVRFFVVARWFACERFRNDFRKAIIYSMYRSICISLYLHVVFLNCFQNSLCEARMRYSGVFSLSGFNPFYFYVYGELYFPGILLWLRQHHLGFQWSVLCLMMPFCSGPYVMMLELCTGYLWVNHIYLKYYYYIWFDINNYFI